MNYIQVEMLRRLRALPNPDVPAAGALREVVILTINGIAAGLKNTGELLMCLARIEPCVRAISL